MIRRCFTLAFLCVALSAQTLIGTIADITGNGSAHVITSTSTSARWVQVIALSTNSAVVRIGDSNTGASRGAPIAAGGGLFLPIPPTPPYAYDLSKIYYYAANGDKLSVTYGK